MHISLEAPEQNAIQAYTEQQVRINSVVYEKNVIVSRAEIIVDTNISSIHEVTETYLEQLLKHKPEIIIMGHNQMNVVPPIQLIAQLAQQGIGIEFMSIGAACRTYNVLLSELRNVVLGIIFKPS